MPDIGIMFRLNDRTADPAGQYEAGLQLIEVAERLGFDSAWITSHHFGSDKGSVASPLLFLAAASQRTSRIRLGAAVVVLSLENPIRVAEDAAIADLLAHGRLELGVGTGLENWAFDAFGVAWDDQHAVFERHLHALRHALSGAELGGGRVLHPPGSALLDKIWRVGTELADVRAIAEAGDHLFVGTSKKRTLAENRRQHAAVIATFREHAGARQRIAMSRHLFVHPDGAEARRQFEAALPSELRARRASPTEPYSLEEAVLVGSPRDVRDALDADPLLPLVDDLLVQVAPAKLTLRQWTASLSLLAAEVFGERRASQPVLPSAPVRALAS
ncbi:LLM class flavin-dependent oxidoreductase [Pseudoxanthobacter sp. M-2]|uniref:LLM class flavin-dependent oxidoreductase n=1 Tax=Pseudoxanthobacter sp. M-2 TaxID=3078754 RepID=UPI0038FC3FFE